METLCLFSCETLMIEGERFDKVVKVKTYSQKSIVNARRQFEIVKRTL